MPMVLVATSPMIIRHWHWHSHCLRALCAARYDATPEFRRCFSLQPPPPGIITIQSSAVPLRSNNGRWTLPWQHPTANAPKHIGAIEVIFIGISNPSAGHLPNGTYPRNLQTRPKNLAVCTSLGQHETSVKFEQTSGLKNKRVLSLVR